MSGKKNTPEMRKKPIWKNIYINSREASFQIKQDKTRNAKQGPEFVIISDIVLEGSCCQHVEDKQMKPEEEEEEEEEEGEKEWARLK